MVGNHNKDQHQSIQNPINQLTKETKKKHSVLKFQVLLIKER
jgi:hypothetical protein